MADLPNGNLRRIEDKVDKAIVSLARVEQKLEDRDYRCLDHAKRLKNMESALGHHNLIAVIIGAIGAGIALMVKYLFHK